MIADFTLAMDLELWTNDSFGSASSSANADRRSGRSRGSFMPPGPCNDTHNLDCILQVIPCLAFLFHRIMVAHPSHMLFLLAVLYIELLELCLIFCSQEVWNLMLDVATPALP